MGQSDLITRIGLPYLFVQPVADRMPTRKQSASRGHARRRSNIEISATNAFGGEVVDAGRFHLPIAITTQIAISDIVEKHQYDIRFFVGISGTGHTRKENTRNARTYRTS
jgi:hypothetical protein